MSEYASLNTKFHVSFIDKTTSKGKAELAEFNLGDFITSDMKAIIPDNDEVSPSSRGQTKGQTMRYGNEQGKSSTQAR